MGDRFLWEDACATQRSRFRDDDSIIIFLSVEKAPGNKKLYWVNPGFSGTPLQFNICVKGR